MIRSVTVRSLSLLAVLGVAACGGNNDSAPASPAAAPAVTPSAPASAASAAAAKPSGSVVLVEPIEGAMGGHIDHFAWQAVEGADAYVIKVVAVTGNRTVWESQPLTATEVTLPPTVALEPEVHTWTVTARKGSDTIATSAVQKFTITP